VATVKGCMQVHPGMWLNKIMIYAYFGGMGIDRVRGG
jgi:hypothetical protein